MSWTRLALGNPVATMVAVLLVVLFGALSLARLPVQLTPEVEKPEITIQTSWRAAAPEEERRHRRKSRHRSSSLRKQPCEAFPA